MRDKRAKLRLGSDSSRFDLRTPTMLLTEEQILIRDSARRFAADHLTPNAATWESEGQFPAAEL